MYLHASLKDIETEVSTELHNRHFFCNSKNIAIKVGIKKLTLVLLLPKVTVNKPSSLSCDTYKIISEIIIEV